MKRLNKNPSIEFYRFLFTCIIFIYHFRTYNNSQNMKGNFSGGYLGVEYFFIISGVFLMQNITKNNHKSINIKEELITFITQKYKRIYPEYFISLVLLMFFSILFSGNYTLLKFITTGYPDLFCLQIFFFNKNINSLLWFVSALIWSSLIIKFFILTLGEKKFYYLGGIISGIYILFVYSYIGNLNITQNHFFYLDGLGRAFSELYIGCIIYKLSLNFNSRKLNNSCILLVSKTIFLFFILIIMYCEGNNHFDFLALICIAGFIFLTIIQNTVSNLCLSNLCIFLGSISYTMYLNQVLIQKVVHTLFSGYNYYIIMLFSIIILVIESSFLHEFTIFFLNKIKIFK